MMQRLQNMTILHEIHFIKVFMQIKFTDICRYLNAVSIPLISSYNVQNSDLKSLNLLQLWVVLSSLNWMFVKNFRRDLCWFTTDASSKDSQGYTTYFEIKPIRYHLALCSRKYYILIFWNNQNCTLCYKVETRLFLY